MSEPLSVTGEGLSGLIPRARGGPRGIEQVLAIGKEFEECTPNRAALRRASRR
jgi:hypothetical protein